MKNKINIFGSLAYDNIIISDKPFAEILDTSLKHQIQGSFYTKTLKKEFGGCSGNIAYSLKLLGTDSLIHTSIGGNDGDSYLKRLQDLSITTHNISVVQNEFTAQAHIINDLHNNQIISFYPGALLNIIDLSKINIAKSDICILSPENKINILNIAKILYENSIKFIFDPGQSLSTYSKDDLLFILPKTHILILNDYELKNMLCVVNMGFDYLINNIPSVIVTKGVDGIVLFKESKKIIIEAYQIEKPIDPTGCGDGFRAGFVFGIDQECDFITSCKYGNAVASFIAENHGTQNHFFTLNEVQKRVDKIGCIND